MIPPPSQPCERERWRVDLDRWLERKAGKARYRAVFKPARDAGLKARHEQKLRRSRR